MKAGIAVFLGALAIFVAVLFRRWNRGTPHPYRDAQGEPLTESLSEKIRIPVNGSPQGMFIKSRNVKNPVLLFVHGGPGMPTYFLDHWFPTGLDQLFTVCWWEQRGAGLSFSPDIPPETMTVEQMIADTIDVARTLCERFGQDKIYLLGHSWGSFIAIQAAARAPELFHAYVGVAQVTYQLRSETLAHAWMVEEYRRRGDQRMVRRLEQATPTLGATLPPAYDALRDQAMHQAGVGTMRDMRSVISGVFLRSFRFPEYSFREKINLWRGKFFSKSLLWQDLLNTDVTQIVTRLDVPVYFLHGRHDYTASYALAQTCLHALDAPGKGFYTFAQSAHSPMHEEPARMRQIMEYDLLAGTHHLADQPSAN